MNDNTSKTNKPLLILVQSTDSPIYEHIAKGIWDRQKFSLEQYAKEFIVHYYTCDKKGIVSDLPEDVHHKAASITSKTFGLRHIFYYIFIVLSAFKWRRRKNSVIRIIGVNLPVLPLLKLISRKYFVVSYQFDWAYGMRKDYKGIKPIISTWVQRSAIKTANHLICTTQWLADIAKDRYKKNNLTIIPNYVNTEVFKPQKPKLPQIAFAGRLHWSKGIDTLINAFKKFVKDNKDYKLIVMGIGEEEEKLKTLGNHENIVFTGGVNNNKVAVFFNESEVFVLPTVNMEGHPKALIEAMAAGCKCITSDVPGNNHVLKESNSSELLFESQNAEELADRLSFAVTSYQKDDQYRYALDTYDSKICFATEYKILKKGVK